MVKHQFIQVYGQVTQKRSVQYVKCTSHTHLHDTKYQMKIEFAWERKISYDMWTDQLAVRLASEHKSARQWHRSCGDNCKIQLHAYIYKSMSDIVSWGAAALSSPWGGCGHILIDHIRFLILPNSSANGICTAVSEIHVWKKNASRKINQIKKKAQKRELSQLLPFCHGWCSGSSESKFVFFWICD